MSIVVLEGVVEPASSTVRAEATHTHVAAQICNMHRTAHCRTAPVRPPITSVGPPATPCHDLLAVVCAAAQKAVGVAPSPMSGLLRAATTELVALIVMMARQTYLWVSAARLAASAESSAAAAEASRVDAGAPEAKLEL
jgi:hypothetical protein